MFWIDLALVCVFALVFSALLTGGLGYRHPAREEAHVAGLFLFVLLFFTIWAGGVWLPPYGPLLWGASWLPFLMVAVFVALLVAAAAPPARPRAPAAKAQADADAVTAVATVFGVFFWILILALLAGVVAHYVQGPVV